MPGLSGSQKAYKLALANVARAASTRAAYFLRDTVPVWINGAARSGMIQASISIDLNTGDEPHRCTFDFKGGSGFVPQAGHSVVVGHGSTANPLFSGRIIKAPRSQMRASDTRPTYHCEAVGHVFELETARIAYGVSTRSLVPRSIALAILSATTPNVNSMGFTASYVDADLPVVEQFTAGPNESLPQVFGRLFRTVDASWYVDHNREMHAFGAVESLPGTVPGTITSANSRVWGVQYQPTDLSRVFTVARVRGASQPTLADVNLSNHVTIPIAASSLITNYNGVDSDILALTTEQFLLDGHLIPSSWVYRPEQAFEPGVYAGVGLDTLAGSNTLVAVSKNVSSLRPFEDQRWYEIAGQYVYCASVIGVYSASGGSIAYAYHVPSGTGAITSDLTALSNISALFNLYVPSISEPNRFVPAGAPVQVYATRTNSAGAQAVSSLFGSTAFGLISRTFEDSRLSPDGAAAVASAALERGAPGTWASIDFVTRDRDFTIGRPVYVAITSTAEPSTASIAGTFTAHDITLGGFGRLTDTKGPERTIRAGTVRRPTLWQILQGE